MIINSAAILGKRWRDTSAPGRPIGLAGSQVEHGYRVGDPVDRGRRVAADITGVADCGRERRRNADRDRGADRHLPRGHPADSDVARLPDNGVVTLSDGSSPSIRAKF